MKKTLLAFIFLYSFSQVIGQSAPQALNYQAVARNASGIIIPVQNINVRFSILEGSTTGNVLYQETQLAVTNNFGLFTLAIGKGTPVTGVFATINWGNGDKYLKVEIAPAGDNNYQLQGTAQLLSVPYALYAEKTNLLAGNAINITNGNTIAANYQAGTGISITGNTISHNLLAGPGISITGNTITSTATNLWQADNNGIHYSQGKVGVGMNADPNIPLSVFAQNTNNGHAALQLVTNDNWHTALIMRNGAVPNQYTFAVGGPGNSEIKPNNFGIFNHNYGYWGMMIAGSSNNIGIGYNTVNAQIPGSKLHVFNGDINIEQIGSGIIMKSPNGQCWRITIDNAGNLVRTSIVCP